MGLRHPYAVRDTTPPSVVTVAGEDYAIAADGTVDCPEDVAATIRAAWEERFGVCLATTTDGDTCGRALPCQYHTED
jgi:hypothetical protein